MKCYFTKHLLNITARIPILLMAIVLASCLLLSSQASGQGLLGKHYMSLGFEIERPNNRFLRDASEWTYSLEFSGNIPIKEKWDINLQSNVDWFGGNQVINGMNYESDLDLTSLGLLLNYHSNPGGLIDPFTGIGLKYSTGNYTEKYDSMTYIQDPDSVYLESVFGLECKLLDNFILRPVVSSASPYRNFTFKNILEDNMFMQVQSFYWWNESWFSGFSVGSDFNDTQVGLGFYLGYGGW